MTDRPKRFALVGRRLGHSYSQRWFEELFRKLGLEGYSYCLHEVESLEGLREWVEAEGIAGFNVTVPYKQAIVPLLDGLSPEAAAIGAVNCVAVGPDGRLTGHNTDAPAFRQTLEELLAAHRLHPSYAYILGTGGAARAVAYALDQMGLDYSFVSRNPEKPAPTPHPIISYQTLTSHLSPLTSHLSPLPPSSLPPSLPNCQLSTVNCQLSSPPNFNFQFSIFNSLIVNATPVGMYPDTDHSPLSPFTFHLSPLTSHLSPSTSHLSPSTSHLSPFTSHLSPFTSPPHFNFQFSIFNSLIVYDLIYNPSPTLLMRQAAAAGAVTTDGLAMLHRQAALSWQIFGPEELRLKGADGR